MKQKNNRIHFQYNLRLFWEFLRRYRLIFGVLVVILLVIEVLSLIDKFLFKIILDKGTAWSTGTIATDQLLRLLAILLMVFLSATFLGALLRWVRMYLVNLLESSLIADVKRKFFAHVLGLSYEFHTTHKTGSLISRLVRGGRAVEGMVDVMVFNMAPLLFQLAVVGVSLWYFDWVPALIVVLTVAVFESYTLLMQQRMNQANMLANETEDHEKAHISDFFTNIESIKYFGKETAITRRFTKIVEQTKIAFLRYWNYFRWLESGQHVILAIGTVLVMYFPLQSFLNGELSLGTVAFIYTAYGNLMGPLFSFVYGLRNFYRVMADFESLFQYLKIKNEIKDTPNAPDLVVKNGAVEFRNVTFSYRGRNIFSHFNLVIPRHSKVAFVGHSGSGKTTLIKLLYRFYDVEKGEILIDGQDIRQVAQESLRSSLSIVPQECVLFDDTVYHNIAFSSPQALRPDILRAMKFAQLDTVVKRFPLQEKTIVGERGIKLSGGEKQRVSIARALLANKKILVLDEATSSLDSKTEHELQQALERLMRGRTTIIIAHRLSTIMKADMIVVIDKGKIVQQGKHQELIAQEGVYKQLWNLQKGGYIK